jgi:hypothetical protein
VKETDWLVSREPDKMLRVRGMKNGSKRKLRLFGCGWLRCIWHAIDDARSREAVELAEMFADGIVNEAALQAFEAADWGARSEGSSAARAAEVLLSPDARDVAIVTADPSETVYDPDFNVILHDHVRTEYTTRSKAEQKEWDSGRAAQADLLRDIFGNPFRPVSFAPKWRTEAAVGIASQMYDSREFGNMPILADALEDAGCADVAILSHCRDPHGVHVRGCWVVDLVLGKS